MSELCTCPDRPFSRQKKKARRLVRRRPHSVDIYSNGKVVVKSVVTKVMSDSENENEGEEQEGGVAFCCGRSFTHEEIGPGR